MSAKVIKPAAPGTVEIEITNSYLVNNRLTVIAKMNGEPMNFNFPGAMAENKTALHQKMKEQYLLMKENIAKNTVKHTKNLNGKATA